MPTDGSSPTVKSADRTVHLLEHLAGLTGSCSLNQLHLDLGIPKSSLHGLLRTLVHRGWVETDESGTRFRLGVRALLVGTSYIDSDEVVRATAPVMDQLGEDCGETIHLARLDTDGADPEVVYLATRQSRHQLRLFSRVGRRLPAHATSLGKALLAEQSDLELDGLFHGPLERLTDNTLTDMESLKTDLKLVRERGYSIDWEENTIGIACIGMALPSRESARDALSISVPIPRLGADRIEELADLLFAATDQLRPTLTR